MKAPPDASKNCISGAVDLALAAMRAAQYQLARCALTTDEPVWSVVDAADLLDAAIDSLRGASWNQ